MEDLTLITCSYNTPDITLTMLKSWATLHGNPQRIIICENSTNRETRDILEKNKIPFVFRPGMSHGHGINEVINLCKTKYALLVDTDIIFLKNHREIFQRFKDMNLTIMGKVEGDRGGKSIYNRVNPWHCFINVEDVKLHNITFFNEQKMKDSFNTSKIYDIGSTFLEDVKSHGLKIGDVDLAGNYYIHFEGMSWYKNKFDSSKKDTGIDFGGTHNNPMYVAAFEKKYQSFLTIKSQYNDVDILDKFIYE